MSYKLKTYIPFSNRTDAMIWLDHNCDKCKYVHCHSKTMLERGFAVGNIPLKRAEWIGYNESGLNDRCNKFTTVRISRPKDSDSIDNFNKIFCC